MKDGPNLPFLLNFPGKNGFIDIAAEIGTRYVLFGTFLLEDNYGYTLRAIENYNHGDPLRITLHILQHWLQGRGRKPVTWQTFVKCLRDSHLNVIADNIEMSLVDKSAEQHGCMDCHEL